ncbi:MAG: TetR family transcriptional regulator C-terminal domain-containing protein [Actinomycetota bacterium]|nr:TetR family transcriptional regulator C-terminal domain-containing protein [Actinomycetota bacterium]
MSATSVEHVLAEAQAGKSQFYRYFPSKEDLVSEVIRYQADHHLGWQRTLLDGLDDWEGLEAYFDALVTSHTARELIGGCPLGSLAAELVDHNEVHRCELAEVFSSWQASIERGMANMKAVGELRADADPGRLAATTLAAIQGGYLLSTLNRDVRPMKDALEAISAYLRSFAASVMGEGPGTDR